jgi:hypothetical protein
MPVLRRSRPASSRDQARKAAGKNQPCPLNRDSWSRQSIFFASELAAYLRYQQSSEQRQPKGSRQRQIFFQFC